MHACRSIENKLKRLDDRTTTSEKDVLVVQLTRMTRMIDGYVIYIDCVCSESTLRVDLSLSLSPRGSYRLTLSSVDFNRLTCDSGK